MRTVLSCLPCRAPRGAAAPSRRAGFSGDLLLNLRLRPFRLLLELFLIDTCEGSAAVTSGELAIMPRLLTTVAGRPIHAYLRRFLRSSSPPAPLDGGSAGGIYVALDVRVVDLDGVVLPELGPGPKPVRRPETIAA